MTIITVDTDGVSGDYSGIEAAVASLSFPLTDDTTIVCSDSTGVTPDVVSASLSIPDMDETTYKLTLEGQPGYKIELGPTYTVDVIGGFGIQHNVRFTRLRITKPFQNGSYQSLINLNGLRSEDFVEVDKCILSGDPDSGQRNRAIIINWDSSSYAPSVAIHDNIGFDFDSSNTSGANSIFNFPDGGGGGLGTCDIYNNYFSGAQVLIYQTNSISKFRNNIFRGITSLGGALWHPDTDYNATELSSLFCSANEVSGVDFTDCFVDAANGDFHLTSSALDLLGAGIGPALDSSVPATDIDGDSRSGDTCSIGPDEYVSSGGGLSIPVVMHHLRGMQ